MESILGLVGLAIFILICWQLSRATRSLSKKSNQKLFARGAHERGQTLVSQRLAFTSRGDLATIRKAILSTVVVAPSAPALLHDAYLIQQTDSSIIYGAGNKLHQSFRGLLTMESTATGTTGTWDIINWTLSDGIVVNQSIMNRLVADINTALRSVDPSSALRPVSNASGQTSSSSAPKPKVPSAPPTTGTITSPATRSVANMGNGLDVLPTATTATTSLAVFNRMRYLLLHQLNARGMSIGHIRTNTTSASESKFEADVHPSGVVTITRSDNGAPSDTPDRPIAQLQLRDLKVSSTAVESMIREISLGIQKEFEGIAVHEHP